VAQGGVRALVVALSAVALLTSAACAALPSGRDTQAPTVAPAASADGVTRVRFDHRDGATGAPPVVVVPRGGTVELVIGSDTAERVVVSGVGQVRYVTAGGTVTLRFVASAPAEVRLWDSGTELGRVALR